MSQKPRAIATSVRRNAMDKATMTDMPAGNVSSQPLTVEAVVVTNEMDAPAPEAWGAPMETSAVALQAAMETPEPAVEYVAESVAPPSPEPVPAPAVVTPIIESTPVETPVETVSGVVPTNKTTAVTPKAVSVSSVTFTLTPAQGIAKMMKSTEELVAFGQANMEAFMKSGQIWAAGMQDLTKQMAATAKTSFEESVSTFKAMSTVKSVKEAMELQSGFAKTAMEKAMAESSKMTDASIKLTEQTLAPITARVTATVETLGKTQAFGKVA